MIDDVAHDELLFPGAGHEDRCASAKSEGEIPVSAALPGDYRPNRYRIRSPLTFS